LARGVQITELSDGNMNPEPVIMQETDFLMEQYLSPSKLVNIMSDFLMEQYLSPSKLVNTK
jgi:hypothetical protein